LVSEQALPLVFKKIPMHALDIPKSYS